MNDAEFEQFNDECIEALRRKNAALREQHGLSEFARWYHESELGVLTLSSPGEESVLLARTTEIGTYSRMTKTWLWTWANESAADAAREKASTFKELSEVTGMPIFQKGYFACSEEDAWELAAACVEHIGSLGCYRARMKHLLLFLSIDTVEHCPPP